ncbi:cytochrome P450 [Hyaloscypha variabilis]
MASLFSIAQQNVSVGLIFLLLILFIGRRVYSVYFGPLAKFPGPKLAAATLWYEFYYDVILQGRYTFKIKELHQKYGPIIRISPTELHIDEPEYYEELYSQHKPRNKSTFYVDQFNFPYTSFTTVDYKLHRARRAALNPFFSKQKVARLQPMLSFMVEKLCNRIEEFRQTGEPLSIRPVYACLTTDVVTLFTVNRSWNHLDTPDFSPLWVETIQTISATGHLTKQFPFIFSTLPFLPRRLIAAMNPGLVMLLDFQNKIQEDTRTILNGVYKSNQEYNELGLDKTIVHALLESDLPQEDKKYVRLWQEAQVSIGAGGDTTANALTTTHFHILNNPPIHRKLLAELKETLPNSYDRVDLRVLEQLPYLNAVVNEGLRFSYGVSTRLQRSHPTEVMRFHEWEIPVGTPVGMTSVHVHHNEAVFPEPYKFKPERWLQGRPQGSPPLDRYLVAFSKGSRQCIGMHLAKAELLMTIAMVFRRFEQQELFETTRADVDIHHDFFVPAPAFGSKGVRVIFK